MSRFFRTSTTVATLALVTLAAACGSDSTAPKPVTAAAEARHLDSLFIAALSAESNDANYENRVAILNFLEVAAAYGAPPTTVSVSANGTKQNWTAYSFGVTQNNDTTFLTLLYDSPSAKNIIVNILDKVDADTGAVLIANDTLYIVANTMSVASAASISGTNCTLQAGLQNPEIAAIFGSGTTCNLATFNDQMADTFDIPPGYGINTDLASISFNNAHVNGVFFVEPDGPLHVAPRQLIARVRALRAAHHAAF